jgi:hypothetical protein
VTSSEQTQVARPSAWWYALPVGLVLVFLGVAVPVLARTSTSGQRQAQALAGPADRIRIELEPGKTYRIYQDAPAGETGSDCRLSPADGDAAGLRFGNWSRWADAVVRHPQFVVSGDKRYRFVLNVADTHRVRLEVSCAGGPVLAEASADADIRVSAAIGLLAPIVLAGVTVVGIAGWRRRRRP